VLTPSDTNDNAERRQNNKNGLTLHERQKIANAAMEHLNLGIRHINKNNSDWNDQASRIAVGCESTLLVVRHCERQLGRDNRKAHDGDNSDDDVDESDSGEHCSYLGYERAGV
jgi:hypothetical protein